MKVSTLLATLAVAATGNGLAIPSNHTHYIQTGITTSVSKIFKFLKGTGEAANATSTGNSSATSANDTYITMKGSEVKMSKYYVEPRPVINVTYTGNHNHVAKKKRTHLTHAGMTVSSNNILKYSGSSRPVLNVTSSAINMSTKVQNCTAVDKHTVEMKVTTIKSLPESDKPAFDGMILRHGSRIITESIPQHGSATKEAGAGNDAAAPESATSTKAAEPTKVFEATEEKPVVQTQEAFEVVGHDKPTTHQVPNREEEVHKISRGEH